MSDMDISRVLEQMRAMKTQAQAPLNVESSGVDKASKEVDFGELLKSAIHQVNSTQKAAGAMTKAFEKGDTDVDLADVMVALQKSSIAFESMKQVRNKLLKAYQDVMSMSV